MKRNKSIILDNFTIDTVKSEKYDARSKTFKPCEYQVIRNARVIQDTRTQFEHDRLVHSSPIVSIVRDADGIRKITTKRTIYTVVKTPEIVSTQEIHDHPDGGVIILHWQPKFTVPYAVRGGDDSRRSFFTNEKQAREELKRRLATS